MRKLLRVTMMGILAAGLGINLAGCSDQATSEKQSTESGPGGKTTVTEKTTVKQSGDNPPAPKAP